MSGPDSSTAKFWNAASQPMLFVRFVQQSGPGVFEGWERTV